MKACETCTSSDCATCPTLGRIELADEEWWEFRRQQAEGMPEQERQAMMAGAEADYLRGR